MIRSKNLITRYYVAIRPQTNEQHNVHKEDCPFLPCDNKRIYLGTFGSGEDAVKEGRKYFIRSNSCRFCTKDHNEEKIQSLFSEIDIRLCFSTVSDLEQQLAGESSYFLN
jgi:hypothetical protein